MEVTADWAKEGQGDNEGLVIVEAFMIGDLKLLAMMLGKENFDGNWCYLCQLYINK